MEAPFAKRIRRLAVAVAATSLFLAGCGNGEQADAEQARVHIASSQAYRDQGQYRAALIEARNAVQLAPNDVDAALALARVYLELGNGRAAAEMLSRVHPSDPGKTALPLARAYLDQGKFSSADETLSNANLTADQQRSADYLMARARLVGREGDLTVAEHLLKEAVQNEPGHVQAAAALVELTLQRDGADAATQRAQEVLQRHQDRPEAQFVYAEIASARQDISGVEEHLTNALSRLPQTDVLTPLKASVLNLLSDVLTQQGRTTEALVYKRLLAEANPEASEMRQQYSDAVTHFRSGNLDEAEKALTQLYERNRGNESSGLFLGLVNLQKGQLDEALELFEEHLDPETASPEMIRAASLANLQKNRPEEALRILREAAQDRPNDADVQAVYGLTALSIPGAEEDGVLALQKAIAQSPEKVNLRVALADYYFRHSRPEQALAQLETAADAAPTNFVVQRAYIGALLQQGNTVRAKTVTTQLQQTAENEAFVWLLSAQVSMVANDFPAALQQLSKSAALAPREPAPLLGLAQLALQQREWNNAARYFERAADLRPDLDQAYKGIITAHESAQTTEQGLSQLKELAEDPAKAPTANAVLAHYYVLNGKPDEARILADQAVAAAGDSRYVRGVAAQTYRSLAESAVAAGDVDQARRLLLDALEMIPTSVPLLSQLAALEIDAGQLAEAEQILTRMETGPAGTQSAALLRAVMLNKQGKGEEALALLDQQWERAPSPDLANHRYLLTKQHNGDADSVLNAWTERFPQDVRPLAFLGMEAQEKGRADAARNHYEHALGLNPNNALVLNNLAWLEFEAGSEKAVELAKRAADLAPNNAAVLDTYGWILVQRGQREEGLKLLERAAAAAPDSAEIREHLESARSQG